MKKKIMRIMSVMLVASMMAATVTGCGARTKATDITIDDGDTIIVDEEDLETEEQEDVTENIDDEITDTEVIGDNTDEETDFVGAEEGVTYTEHEFFYVRDELDKTRTNPMNMNELKQDGLDYTLYDSVDIYTPSQGILTGYTKPNISVHVTSRNDDWYCIYFENEESPNDYVLVKASDFIAATGSQMEEMITVTPEEIVDEFNAYFSQDSFKIVEKSDDMEYIDVSAVTISSEAKSWVEYTAYENNLTDYTEFCIEPLDKESHDSYAIWFRIYYK